MASLTTDNRLQWVCPYTGIRKQIRLGRMDRRTAKMVAVRVERLVASNSAGEEPDAETRAWARSLAPTFSEKLAKAGLLGRSGNFPTGLAAFIEHFIAVKGGGVSQSTNNHYRQARDRAVAFFGKGKDICSMTVGDAMAFAAWLRSKEIGLNSNSANKRCATMRVFFQYAADCEVVVKNPFADKRVEKVVRPAKADRRFHLPHADALTILGALPDVEARAIFALCRWGGLRIGEALAMEWNQVDWETDRFTVLSPKTAKKGKESRITPLFPEIAKALLDLQEAAPKREPRLFPSYEGKTPQWAGKVLEAACKRAGIKPWVRLWQNLRATRATELAGKYPSFLCAEWLGHTEAVADANYRRATEEHYREAAKFETGKQVEQKAAHLDQERVVNKGNVLFTGKLKNPDFSGFPAISIRFGNLSCPRQESNLYSGEGTAT